MQLERKNVMDMEYTIYRINYRPNKLHGFIKVRGIEIEDNQQVQCLRTGLLRYFSTDISMKMNMQVECNLVQVTLII